MLFICAAVKDGANSGATTETTTVAVIDGTILPTADDPWYNNEYPALCCSKYDAYIIFL